ncbi:MAG TPA: thiamine pyrophosphate-dependent enzyme [Verrucomicrobiae bacterium]|nr:thiamine pyrophosphate-dependent enzyme [Verrucomicrobiae bacterium]
MERRRRTSPGTKTHRYALGHLRIGANHPPDAIVVEETITHRLSIHRYLDMLKPGTFFAGCIGGLGTGTGTALGVKAANPRRPVLCLIGDGAFNYDPGLAALGVCQEHNLPIMIVLYNNYGYHSQKSGVPRFFPDGFAVKKPGLHWYLDQSESGLRDNSARI